MKKVSVILLFILLGISSAFSQEEKFKALFIYNFTKHIEWPASAKTGDFVIGVVNDNVLYDKIVEITAGKKAGAQNIVVTKFANPEDITKCHILYVSSNSSGAKNLPVILSKTAGQSTLLVTERAGLATKGASINFVIDEGKLKFELNKATAAEQNLKVSSYLENLAILI